MRVKVGYPKTVKLLDKLGNPAIDVMIQGFGPFTYINRKDGVKTRRAHKYLSGLILYPVFIWEKRRNLH